MTRYVYIFFAALVSLGVSANASPAVEKRAFTGAATWTEQGLASSQTTSFDIPDAHLLFRLSREHAESPL